MTDRDGYFSFVPFEDGPWRITVEDDMGHKGEVTLTIAGSGLDQGDPAASSGLTGGAGRPSLAFRIILGLSLILNIFAVYNFILRRGFKAPGPEAGSPKGGEYAHQ
jgi:hypothetical protein